MQEQINEALGLAIAIEKQAQARQKALELVAEALNKKGGLNSASLTIAEKYTQAFSNLAKQSNTLIIPAAASDVGAMVSQALTIYKGMGGSASADSTSFQQQHESDQMKGKGDSTKH